MLVILTDRNAKTQPQTIQVITPTALRCACDEYRVNRFCAHMVYYTVAKIEAFCEKRTPNADAQRKEVMQLK